MPPENQIVKATFNITSSNEVKQPTHLIINAGEQGISFIEWDQDTNTFISVIVFHFAKQLTINEIAEDIENILKSETLLQKVFAKTEIIWCFNESILVPNEYFNKSIRKETLDVVFGGIKQSSIKDELVLKYHLHNVYSINADIENKVTKHFSNSIQTHQSSLLIDIEPNERDLLYCHFYSDSMTIVLRKQGQLQVIQNFDFNTPVDVVYQILNVCRSFEVEAAAIVLTVSGMIDADSNLFTELYKYFASIKFYTLPSNHNYGAEIKEQPAHYFSHLFALASCV